MTLQPLLDAPLAVQIHVATVLPAAVLGIVLLLGRKGTRLHRLFGRIWVGLMAATALASFFIHEIGGVFGFSPIHLLSVLTLFGLWDAVARARAGDLAGHRRRMRQLNLGAIGLAGLFTLLPGRRMGAVLFGDPSWPELGLFAGLGLLPALAAGVFLRSQAMRVRGR
ncbi:hypothetical protein BJF92_06380 [Rhizobium rhizosphaerae]|uniref:DUF2306 domain-containing protein n=1 Tax=Xaviernesmea rhizosphaerae TaxID=1672749 RepID=A0A1Q9ANX9_9HYPH|nr:DUF2306 domain-containing protein [Xaviernesmea rhizosphaerae]OLP57152.1 hypothetical protein BJF92_06380 [Xaviernesmea rhizosphaerae]